MGCCQSPETGDRKASHGIIDLCIVTDCSGIYLLIGLWLIGGADGRVLMYIYDRWLFKIPVYFTVDYISRHLLAETDFVKEARNGARMREYIEGEPLLRDRVFIPKVFPEILSPRVMVAEVYYYKSGCPN